MEHIEIASEPNAGIYREPTLEKLKTFKSIIQKMIIWTLIGGAIFGAMSILCVDSEEAVKVLGKFMGTLFLLAGSALATLIDFNGIESKQRGSQVFATLGIVMNILWTFLWLLALWGAFDIWARGNCYTYSYGSSYCPIIGYSIMGIFTMASSYLSALGLFGSVTMKIYEGNKKSTIRPLKLTAISCLVYAELHATFRLFTSTISSSHSSSDITMAERLDILAGFAGFVWLVTAVVAAILSKHEKDTLEFAERKEKDEKRRQLLEQAAMNISNQQPQAPKADEELRAEIEEKVRREMIEKEVREKLEKEAAEKTANSDLSSNNQ